MTRRQLQVLNYIRAYMGEHGIAPSRREITTAVGYKSVSRANAAVDALVAHGRIKRIPNRARAIELVTGEWEKRAHLLELENAYLRKELAQYQGVAT